MSMEQARKSAKKAVGDHLEAAYKMWCFHHNIRTDLNAVDLLEAWEENELNFKLPSNDCDLFLRALSVAIKAAK